MSKQLIGKVTELKPKNNHTIELKMQRNGKPMKVILDTGSPISIIPANMRDWIQPKIVRKPPSNRQFMDLNDNEVSVSRIHEIETQFFDKVENLDWWEMKIETRPILDMDNFTKLDLKITQGS